jgi:hypothetical protein
MRDLFFLGCGVGVYGRAPNELSFSKEQKKKNSALSWKEG